MNESYPERIRSFEADYLAEQERYEFLHGTLTRVITYLTEQNIDLYSAVRRDADTATIRMILARMMNHRGFKHKYIAEILGYKTAYQMSDVLVAVNGYYKQGDKKTMYWDGVIRGV